MKYLTEFRNGEIAQRMTREISQITTQPWKIMEVCGGQTHSIIKNGIDQMLPPGIEMVHGPGCPVCVTPLELIDKALAIAAQPGVIFCSFGDMLRVPGTESDLFQVKGRGGDVRVVYSPLDAVDLAMKFPDKQVVFFGVGFETTAPANAMSVHLAKRRGLKNFSVLVSHVLVPPAIEAIMSAPGNLVQAFLLAGHVCSVMGYWEYPPLAERFRIPLIVTGFEPLDLLDGIRRAVVQLEAGRYEVENAYERVVTFDGNRAAQRLLSEVFERTDRAWRGIGVIPKSGWRLNDDYRDYDAEERFHITGIHTEESPLCHSGDVLRGAIKPAQCPAFGKECTPRHPLGATMVSSEGACAAYYNYGRFLSAAELANAGTAVSGTVAATL
ncbi:MAG TPA: hydrogenase formation protein HypD [Terracidiphilus sp.]|jgi:hydrogenase expression/formation protein HypD|nr:hydrogenase formation protein HypD [Terracidiphilus sp.]